MILNGSAIQREIDKGHLIISPFRSARLRKASYVLSLGNQFRRWVPATQPIVLWAPDSAERHLSTPIAADQITIFPGEFILGCSTEEVSISNNRFGILSPLSHIARFGLGVHGGADFINPGYGQNSPTRITFELYNYNSSPLLLNAGMPLAHLRIGALRSANTPIQASIYEGSDPLIAPQFFEEWHHIEALFSSE